MISISEFGPQLCQGRALDRALFVGSNATGERHADARARFGDRSRLSQTQSVVAQTRSRTRDDKL